MIVDVILGVNIDTDHWIKELKAGGSDHVIVLDYDYFGEPIEKDSIIFFSIHDIKIYLRKFDSIYFYKSLYGYPGMNGNMASIYKKQKEK